MLRRGPLKPVSQHRRDQQAMYDHARQRAYQRDNGQCQAAGVWPEIDCWGKVDVHHVARQSTHPELRCELSNLQTLCRGHHTAVHLNPALARERGLLA